MADEVLFHIVLFFLTFARAGVNLRWKALTERAKRYIVQDFLREQFPVGSLPCPTTAHAANHRLRRLLKLRGVGVEHLAEMLPLEEKPEMKGILASDWFSDMFLIHLWPKTPDQVICMWYAIQLLLSLRTYS